MKTSTIQEHGGRAAPGCHTSHELTHFFFLAVYRRGKVIMSMENTKEQRLQEVGWDEPEEQQWCPQGPQDCPASSS